MNHVEVQYHIKYRKAGEWVVCGYRLGLEAVNRVAIKMFEEDNDTSEIVVFKCVNQLQGWKCRCPEELTGCKKM